MKVNDDVIKQARSLINEGKYVTDTNWSVTQPCVYDGDDTHHWVGIRRKTADDLLEWIRRKQGNRSS